jgi:hypothetical protein
VTDRGRGRIERGKGRGIEEVLKGGKEGGIRG